MRDVAYPKKEATDLVEGVKGTTTIGITFEKGTILAGDKRASAGHVVASKTAKKVKPITDKVAITISGSVAGAQMLYKWIRSQISRLAIDTERESTVSSVANLTATILHANFRRLIPFQVHFLIGGEEDGKGKLFYLDHTGSLQEDDYIASGSGSPIALGILERKYKKDMGEDEAIKMALDTLSSAIKRDVYTGDGIDVAKIDEEEGFKLIPIEELKEYAKDLDILIRTE